ncbi:MarR family winged helix-turn-helix transcriptional regulator [Sporomusa acidovorans]|uniref:Multidrug resistance operon repressor n=1 Tax=Sporomusa acidovorans (strain ATCC 49682 / DSM 3132 / Mol) TaxID=1123286 RepID=A0ABZ3JA91_SPOA4|nr:MarR family transcriptional regulator [Sporomusa acidovorans]OZC16131.1 multidrug resistance operon repressor [Sporomusa acidovorans DSM 3132]SDF82993.1 transcriptional regulator, MarR family [Sporomusa acidovorans]
MNFKLDDSLGFILNKVNTKLKNELFQQLKENDVTPEQWAILNCLWEQEGVTPKELSDLTFKDKPNTNRILEKLIIKGLVVRKAHPVDKRSFQIFLTDDGWALREQLIPKVKQLLDKATAGIEQHKVAEMKKMLNQIYDNIK